MIDIRLAGKWYIVYIIKHDKYKIHCPARGFGIFGPFGIQSVRYHQATFEKPLGPLFFVMHCTHVTQWIYIHGFPTGPIGELGLLTAMCWIFSTVRRPMARLWHKCSMSPSHLKRFLRRGNWPTWMSTVRSLGTTFAAIWTRARLSSQWQEGMALSSPSSAMPGLFSTQWRTVGCALVNLRSPKVWTSTQMASSPHALRNRGKDPGRHLPDK